MRLIHVIPIARGISKETLSYFTGEEVSLGSIVSVPLRKKTVFGLVVGSEKVTDIKTEIKSLPYEIRKMDKVKAEKFLIPEFIRAAERAAEYHAATLGSVLSALLPKTILENIETIEKESATKEPERKLFETTVLEDENDERLGVYKSLIRESFAKQSSIFLCLPTNEEVERVEKKLPKGIENYTCVIHNALPKKKLLEAWGKAMTLPHSALIIATPQFLSLPRSDISTIILERENSRAWKTLIRPFLDFRIFASFLAKERQIRLVLADSLLRVETRFHTLEGNYHELTPLKFRSLSSSRSIIVDMKQYKGDSKTGFRVVSNELAGLIKENRERNEHLFIFAGRRGFSPATICRDCGTTVVCGNCKAPITLHTTKENGKRMFLCHHCGEQRSAEERCVHCGSWNLITLGVGVDRVEEELKKVFPDIKLFKADIDSTPTKKKVLVELGKFYASPGSILLGTELALFYMEEKVENSAVISIDHFSSIPDFRINEKLLSLLFLIRSLTQKYVIIQTRNPTQKILQYATQGLVNEFFQEEIKARKQFGYPPFRVIIKVSVRGTKSDVAKTVEEIKKNLSPYEISFFPAYMKDKKGNSLMHGVIKIETAKWPGKTLLEKLLSFPPRCEISVDPDNFL